MAAESTPDPDRLAQLADLAQQLVEDVEDLSAATGGQLVALSRHARANRQMIWLAIAVAVLAVAIGAVLVIGWMRSNSNTDRIDRVTSRLDTAQTVQRREALCPLYGLFLSSRNDKSRAAYPQGVKAYDKAFGIIQDGYDALQCSAFIARNP